jgi:YVTN family beta-propeller protein
MASSGASVGVLFASHLRSNSVSVIDTSTLTVIKEIPVGELPWGVMIPQ